MSLVLSNGYIYLFIFNYSFNASSVMSSLTPCYLYTTSKGEGEKYLKEVSKGDLPVEV
jgi:hypothetical protein